MTTTTRHVSDAKGERSSLERRLVESMEKVGSVPNEDYWRWIESPEGKSAIVNLLAGTYGDALIELEKN